MLPSDILATVKTLTERQKMVYDFVKGEIEENGTPPSIRQIGKAVGLSSSSTVHSHLRTLEEVGLLVRRDQTRGAAYMLEGAVVRCPSCGQDVSLPIPKETL